MGIFKRSGGVKNFIKTKALPVVKGVVRNLAASYGIPLPNGGLLTNTGETLSPAEVQNLGSGSGSSNGNRESEKLGLNIALNADGQPQANSGGGLSGIWDKYVGWWKEKTLITALAHVAILGYPIYLLAKKMFGKKKSKF